MLGNKNNSSNSSNMNELRKLLLKDKEIEEFRNKNNPLYNIKPGEKIFSINFISFDKKISNYGISCKKTDIFDRIEEQLYEDFPEYKEKETYFMKNGNKIKRLKSLDENNIKRNDVIELCIYNK